jgi:origin recognition complex subunit 3
MDNQKAYVFTKLSDRPNKRRRIDTDELKSSWSLRKQCFQELWAMQRSVIDEVIEESHSNTLTEVLQFLDNASNTREESKLPCGFILGELDSTVHALFFQQLAEHVSRQSRSIFVQLKSSECTNLKSLLKTLIRKASSSNEDSGNELTNRQSSEHGRKLLDYDVHILHDCIRKMGISQLVISFLDSEAFEAFVLAEVIELLRYVLLLGRVLQ